MYHKNCMSVLCSSLVSVGAILIVLKSYLYGYGMRTLLTLEPGSPLFKAWSKSPRGIYLDVYVFNWTNPWEFLNHSTKPILKEIGPFRFEQIVEKVNASFHKNGTISYYRKRTYTFNRDGSVHNLDCNLTIPNPVAMALAHKGRDWNFFMKKTLSYALKTLVDNNIHITKTAGDMLFHGYEDPILNAAHKFSFITNVPNMDKFAWFYKKNGSATYDGIFNMGVGGTRPLGQIYQWNYKTNTTYYEENCSSFEGSAGEFFPRFRKDNIVKLFHSDICRTLYTDYAGNATRHGIEGLKYILGDHAFDNGTFIPGNECTCGDHCLPYGVIYATACKGDSPNYFSLPHFHKADPIYADRVLGMKPDPRKHEFHIIYEPNSGLPLELAPRLQVNVLMEPISNIGMYEKIPSLLFPVLWMEQIVAMPSSKALFLRILLNLKNICMIFGIPLVILGILIFLFVNYKIRNSDLGPQDYHKKYFSKELVPLKEKETRNC